MTTNSSVTEPSVFADALHLKQLNIIAEQAATINRLQHESKKDDLTRLHNFGYWQDSMEIFKHKGDDAIMLVSIDVNMLKPTNDNFGHDVGDKLLINVSQVLNAAFRDDDIIVRKGGDEFAVAVPLNYSELKAEYDHFISENYSQKPPSLAEFYEQRIYHRIQTLVNKFNDNLPEGQVPLSLSYGAALSEPKLGMPPHDLDEKFRLADERMYHMKQTLKALPIEKFLLK